MDAIVNIKLSPRQFDLMRSALETARLDAHSKGNDQSFTPAERRGWTSREALLAELADKLNQ